MVTPPWDEDVIIGICCPLGESGLTAVVGGALPRRALGIYGVYVVCTPMPGCRGGGRGGALPLDAGGGGKGRLATEAVGEEVTEEEGLSYALDVTGDIGFGTMSG